MLEFVFTVFVVSALIGLAVGFISGLTFAAFAVGPRKALAAALTRGELA